MCAAGPAGMPDKNRALDPNRIETALNPGATTGPPNLATSSSPASGPVIPHVLENEINNLTLPKGVDKNTFIISIAKFERKDLDTCIVDLAARGNLKDYLEEHNDKLTRARQDIESLLTDHEVNEIVEKFAWHTRDENLTSISLEALLDDQATRFGGANKNKFKKDLIEKIFKIRDELLEIVDKDSNKELIKGDDPQAKLNALLDAYYGSKDKMQRDADPADVLRLLKTAGEDPELQAKIIKSILGKDKTKKTKEEQARSEQIAEIKEALKEAGYPRPMLGRGCFAAKLVDKLCSGKEGESNIDVKDLVKLIKDRSAGITLLKKLLKNADKSAAESTVEENAQNIKKNPAYEECDCPSLQLKSLSGKYNPEESNKPQDNQWNPYKGGADEAIDIFDRSSAPRKDLLPKSKFARVIAWGITRPLRAASWLITLGSWSGPDIREHQTPGGMSIRYGHRPGNGIVKNLYLILSKFGCADEVGEGEIGKWCAPGDKARAEKILLPGWHIKWPFSYKAFFTGYDDKSDEIEHDTLPIRDMKPENVTFRLGFRMGTLEPNEEGVLRTVHTRRSLSHSVINTSEDKFWEDLSGEMNDGLKDICQYCSYDTLSKKLNISLNDFEAMYGDIKEKAADKEEESNEEKKLAKWSKSYDEICRDLRQNAYKLNQLEEELADLKTELVKNNQEGKKNASEASDSETVSETDDDRIKTLDEDILELKEEELVLAKLAIWKLMRTVHGAALKQDDAQGYLFNSVSINVEGDEDFLEERSKQRKALEEAKTERIKHQIEAEKKRSEGEADNRVTREQAKALKEAFESLPKEARGAFMMKIFGSEIAQNLTSLRYFDPSGLTGVSGVSASGSGGNAAGTGISSDMGAKILAALRVIKDNPENLDEELEVLEDLVGDEDEDSTG